VWMDSIDAYHHADGRLARGSVAAVEAQALAYDALCDASTLTRAGTIFADYNALWVQAQRLRRSLLAEFWVTFSDRGSFFASGVERTEDGVSPLQVRTANMGMLLNSRVLDGATNQRYVGVVVQQLFNPTGLWCPSGIRTLAEGEQRFRPFGYHNGTVWPWQNLWIARGLRHHGELELATRVEQTIKRVATELHCMPEFVQGVNDAQPLPVEGLAVVRSPDGNGGEFEHELMQPAQKFQGWTAFGLYALDAKKKSASQVA